MTHLTSLILPPGQLILVALQSKNWSSATMLSAKRKIAIELENSPKLTDSQF